MKHHAQFKQWFSPISSAAALVLLMAAGNATALSLGSIHVRSSLGETFSADVDVNSLTAAEAESLRVNLADPVAYGAAGLEMSSSLQGANVTLEKSADGRSYLRIQGVKPVNDPFIDLLIHTDTAESGRATRGYTVLIDPPAGLTKAPKIAPAILAPVPKAVKVPKARSTPVPAADLETAPAPEPVAEKAAPRPAVNSEVAADGLRVQRGTTASVIARQMAAQQGVSFDQMLAALVRQNPDAFIGGNVNRIKTGAVLQAPSAEQANSVSQHEAKRQWMASGNNFKQYRRRLAQMDASTVDASIGRSSRGSVKGEVSDSAGSGVVRDKLTLGKARSRRGSEDKVLRKRHRAESSARQAELSKNIEELKKLSGAAGQSATDAKTAGNGKAAHAAGLSVAGVGASAMATNKVVAAPKFGSTAVPAAPKATATPAATPTPAPTATHEPSATPEATATQAAAAEGVASAAVASASEVASAAAAASTNASESATVAATQAPTHAPLAQEKTDESSGGLMDSLSNWALPLGGLLGAGVLGGLGFAWMRRRKNKGDGAVDSAAFLESKLEADSFFDASGGQRVDTSAHSSGISSSMVYSPSQLDAAGDVDPVAEAGVYMAYNRDQQAEDILKEAMRITPSRVAIYTTLMEIYAKRGDLKAFDVVAREAHHLTGGHGDEWAKAQEMGRQIEPSNPMYGGAASPSTAAEGEDGTSPDAPFIDRPAVAPTAPMTLEQAQETAKIEANDLDMVFRNSDFKLSESEASEIPVAHLATAPMQIETAGAVNAAADAPTSHMDLAFDLEIPSAPAPVESVDAQFTETALSGITAAAPEALKFDMSDLSLDLTDGGNVAAVPPVAEMASGEASPWLTKLELAREFVALGDSDGARAMAEEVIANAPADVADKARTFIATMV